MPVDAFLRGFLATYFLLIALVYGAKHAAHRNRDGVSPMDRPAAGLGQEAGIALFRVFRMTILAVCVARVFLPQIDPWLAPLTPLDSDVAAALGLVGAALMLLGAWRVFYAHTYMGALWRAGAPDAAMIERGPDALLQRGPFSRTRNPIFVGVLLTQLGFALALPTVFAVLCLGVGALTLLRQVEIEEAALAKRFGPSYAAYCARTPRWV